MVKVRTDLTVISQVPRTYDWGERANFPLTKKDIQVVPRQSTKDFPATKLTKRGLQTAFEKFVADGVVEIHNVPRTIQGLVVDRLKIEAKRMAQRALQFNAACQIARTLVEHYSRILNLHRGEYLRIAYTAVSRGNRPKYLPAHSDKNSPTPRVFGYPYSNGEFFIVFADQYELTETGVHLINKYSHLPRYTPAGQDNGEMPIVPYIDGLNLFHGTRKIDTHRKRILQRIEFGKDDFYPRSSQLPTFLRPKRHMFLDFVYGKNKD